MIKLELKTIQSNKTPITEKQLNYLLFLFSKNSDNIIESFVKEDIIQYIDKFTASKIIGNLLKGETYEIYFNDDIENNIKIKQDYFNELTTEEAINNFESYKKCN